MKHLVYLFALPLVLIFGCAQEKILAVNSPESSFIFKAQSALPMGGQARQLTPGFELLVTKDSVVAYLPYFGRAYNINPYSDEGGIKFTSTKFSYTVKEKKKGAREIIIKPEDHQDVQQLSLVISQSGYGSLQVVSLNRQPISYNGYMEKRQ